MLGTVRRDRREPRGFPGLVRLVRAYQASSRFQGTSVGVFLLPFSQALGDAGMEGGSLGSDRRASLGRLTWNPRWRWNAAQAAFFRPRCGTPWGHSEPHTLLRRLRSIVAEVEVPGDELQRAFEGTWDIAGQELYEPGTDPKWS